MSEKLSACKALAAMIRDHGTPSVDEVVYVAHAALELGLDPDENAEVQTVLQEGGDFGRFLAQVEAPDVQLFLFRRVVSASLIDAEINDDEKKFIAITAEAFNYEPQVVEEYISWMCQGIDWERKGAGIISRLPKA